ncbi:MAG: J domain-containing protein [Chloroflexi bacterium]|nr:J domain-containing protein [Chloroflexota bacterium]
MSMEAAEEPFKDYYLILQVHPEADAGMVEAAYWHLARRYNDASPLDATTKAKLDMLNEAYSVLGTPSRRQAYTDERNAVLGVGALPVAPPPPPVPVPLAVMERQRPQPVALTEPPPELSWRFDLNRFSTPSWQNALLVLALLTAATAALAASVNLVIVLGLLVIGLAVSALPVLRELPKLSSLLSRKLRGWAGRRDESRF